MAQSLSNRIVSAAIWGMGTKRNLSQMDEESWNALVEKYREENSHPVPNPRKTVRMKVEEETFEGMQVFSWNSDGTRSQDVIFYIHGGAYIAQPMAFHFRSVAAIAEMSCARVVFPVYPKAPGHTFRDAFPPMERLYERELSRVDSSGKITLMGDSAGGGFALGLAHSLSLKGIPQPVDIILLSPWLDVSMDNPEIPSYEKSDAMLSAWGLRRWGEMWAGGKENIADPRVSPIHSDSLDKLGWITIFCGTHEIFCPDCRKLHSLLEADDIEHDFICKEEMGHVYPLYPTPEGRYARGMIADMIIGII